MANISVTVQDGNNITLVSTPTATQVITIDRGIAGPAGPAGVPGGSTTQVQYNLNSAFAGSPNFTFNGSNLVLQSASASDAFRITQTGSGNAFVVEDSANPDVTPFVINSAGTVLAGFSTAPAGGYKAYVSGTGFATSAWRVGDNTDGSTSAALINLSNSTKSAQVAADPGNVGANTILNFAVDGTTWATLNSSGYLGIGTTAPLTTLNVNGTGGELLRISVTSDSGTIQEPALGFAMGVTNVYPATKISALEFDASDARASMLFYTRGTNSDVAPTEQMRIDSAGNLGLGVTPSAWDTFKVMEFSNIGAVASVGPYMSMMANARYQSSTYRYTTTEAATHYAQAAGQHQFFNAPPGTAGNAITFTQAMTLDSSGNLGIGTTSPGERLHVSNSSAADVALQVQNNTHSSYLRSDGTGTQIGTNSATKPIYFYVGAAERMRLDSAGNLLVGTTSATTHTLNKDTATEYATVIRNGYSGTGTFGILSWLQGTTSGTAVSFFDCIDGGGIRLRIAGTGNVTNTNGSYGAISDIKLKENIVDATPKLDKLNQVRIVNYNLIGEEQKQIGVVAQELEQIFPGMIDESPDRDKEGNDLGTTTKSVKYSVFVPMLIKAMQEQQAMIEELKTRLAAAGI